MLLCKCKRKFLCVQRNGAQNMLKFLVPRTRGRFPPLPHPIRSYFTLPPPYPTLHPTLPHHTHPTPPHPTALTRDVSKQLELQANAFPSRKLHLPVRVQCALWSLGAGPAPGRLFCGTWLLVPLQGVRCEMSIAVLVLGLYVTVFEKERVRLLPENILF